MLIDKNGNANIIYYSSLRTKRVTRSVLASELFSMGHGFDISSIIGLTLNAMLDDVKPLQVYTYSRILHDFLVRINRTAEKRLLIDLRMLRQSYERREITEVFRIPTEQKQADELAKAKAIPPLQQLLDENHLHLIPNA